ncbi:MAG: hypothetical protein PHF84_07330 [bacterium]|nr:hypothetical protein [bacterium]
MHSPYQINDPAFLLVDDPVPHSGKFNMEFDEWLFTLLQQGRIKNALRIYEWEGPVITYGLFQAIGKDINKDECAKDRVELVKRPTGGRAILHYRELTFSLVLHPGSIEPYDFRNSFLLAADLITDSFADLNIKASVNLKPHKYEEKALCFQSLSQYEIIDTNGNKLTGIAQHFTKEGVLIQGSIPLKSNEENNKYFNLRKKISLTSELIERNTEPGEMRRSLLAAAARKFKLAPFFE